MPTLRQQISDKEARDPTLLRLALQRAHDRGYELLERITALEDRIARAQGSSDTIITLGGGGLTDAERALLDALATGSTDTPLPGQTSVVPAYPALPPVQGATNGQLIYLTTDQRIYRFSSTPAPGIWIAIGISGGSLSTGTYAARPAANTKAAGDVYWATDRTVAWINISNTWTYLFGTHAAALASLPSLGTADAGYLFYATDYYHLWKWTGSIWHFAPGDEGSGYIGWYTELPQTGLWAICNGTTVSVAQDGATTSSVTLPDFASFGISFTDQNGVARSFDGVYPKASTSYSGTVEGPYYTDGSCLTGAGASFISGDSPFLFPVYLALLAYLRQ